MKESMSEPPTSPPPLEYGHETTQQQAGTVRNVVFGFIGAAVAVFLVWQFLGESITRAWRSQFSDQRRCFNYRASPQQIVYEEDQVSARKLLDASGYRPLRVGSLTFAIFRPRLGRSVEHLFENPSATMLFMHERASPNGRKCLVTVEYRVDTYFGSAAEYYCRVWSPDWSKTTPLLSSNVRPYPAVRRDQSVPLQFYAGQPDPADPTHFTIRYTMGEKQGVIHGFVKDTGNGEFDVRLNSPQGLMP